MFNFLFKMQVFLRKNTSILVENSSATTFIRDSIECFSFFFEFKVQAIIPMPKNMRPFFIQVQALDEVGSGTDELFRMESLRIVLRL